MNEPPRMHWRQPVPAQPGTEVLQAIERAIGLGAVGFADYRSEPDRGAWWGRLECGQIQLFVKGRQIRSWRQRLASLLLPRGLIGEFDRTLWLQQQSVPTAELFALGECRRGGFLQQSVLVFGWVSGSRTLAEAARDATAVGEDRLALIGAAGTLFGQLFASGAIHKQFHPWNVLVTGGAGTAEMTLLPVDLQHLWNPGSLRDADFCWALTQVSFWLHDPVVDWSDSEQARSFYDSAVAAARPRLSAPDQIEQTVEQLVARGRIAGKLRRKDWSPAGVDQR